MKIDTKTIVKIGIGIFLLYLCIYYWPTVSGLLLTLFEAIVPLLIGCIIAYIVNLIMSFYERHYFVKTQNKWIKKSRRPVCMLGAIISLFAVIAIIMIIVAPQLTSCVKLLFAKLPSALDSAVDRLEAWNILPEDIMATLNSLDWNSIISKVAGALTSGITNIVGVVVGVVTSVIGGFVTAFVSVMFAVYLLLGKDKLGRQINGLMRRFLPQKRYDTVKYTVGVVNASFRRYIVGQCTEAAILGVLCALGMWILRMPYAAMIGALIAFTSLVPIAGAYAGGIIGAFMIFTVSPIQALVFVIFLIILQQIEGNLIYPKVVGTSVGLPAIWVLAAVAVGGGVMGVAGMLLGVPLAAAIYKIIRDKLHGKKINEQTATEE